MKEDVFREILNKLEGLDYFFISGMAVAVYSEGKRVPGDIDIVVRKGDIGTFAGRIGAVAGKRFIDKGTFIVEDYGFEFDYKGQMVECTTGYPPKRVSENTFDKLFERKRKMKYLGLDVYVEPLEELINQKAFMRRPKDMVDLELLKGKNIDPAFFREICEDKGNLNEVLPVVQKYFQI